MSFDTLGLRAELLRAVRDAGYDVPTPVQAKAIPAILTGQDLMAGAQTGTGKTAGFALPLLQRLSDNVPAGKYRPVRALVLAPTRELAAQVGDSVKRYGQHLPLRSTVVFGGVNINPQIDKLRRGVDILVATPGRLLDHCQQGNVDLSRVEILVLDEADRMLDMGFIHDIKRVLKLLPAKRQNLLFSATFAKDIKSLADRLLNNPAMIEVARRSAPAEAVAQSVIHAPKAHKAPLLSWLIGSRNLHQVLVFTRTKHGANRLAERLEKAGLPSAAIHGNKSQGARTRALAEFKANKVRVLVATDIAARGLDISGLPQVVNFDLPEVAEDYIHRIGRTGRAGASGHALSLVSPEQKSLLKGVEKLLGRAIDTEVIKDFTPAEADLTPIAQPEQRKPQRPRRGQSHGDKPRHKHSRPENQQRGRRPKKQRQV